MSNLADLLRSTSTDEIDASVRRGGSFLTKDRLVAWWKVAPSTGLYHAVTHAVGPTLCRRNVPLVSLSVHDGMWPRDPSNDLMTCRDCCDYVYRVRGTSPWRTVAHDKE